MSRRRDIATPPSPPPSIIVALLHRLLLLLLLWFIDGDDDVLGLPLVLVDDVDGGRSGTAPSSNAAHLIRPSTRWYCAAVPDRNYCR